MGREYFALHYEHVEVVDQDDQFAVPFFVFFGEVVLPTCVVVDLLLHKVDQLDDALFDLLLELLLVLHQ